MGIPSARPQSRGLRTTLTDHLPLLRHQANGSCDLRPCGGLRRIAKKRTTGVPRVMAVHRARFSHFGSPTSTHENPNLPPDCCVQRSGLWRPVQRTYSEDAEPVPVSPYGQHRLMMEQVRRSYAVTFGLRSTVARLFSVYGSHLRKQLLWDMCSRLHRGERTLVMGGTGAEVRDWIDVRDVARLFERSPRCRSEKAFR